jgi:enoyl-CoA hydratase/carnithine racemase
MTAATDLPYVLRDGAIAHLVLNSPERLNAIDYAQHDALLTALRAAEEDPEIRVIALSGEGRAFCAGDYIKADGRASWPERLRHRWVDLDVGVGPLLLNEVTTAFRDCLKPTVALMHGFALGAGYDYASSCDFRLATPDCVIGDPRIRLALWGAEGWSYKLARLIGQAHVAPMAFLGELLSGTSALELGFVHRVYGGSEPLRIAARDFLTHLASLDPAAYRKVKSALLDGLDLTYPQALRRG